MKRLFALALAAAIFAPALMAPPVRAAEDAALRAAIAAPTRTPSYAARDSARHPYEVLTFFGIRPDMTVIEIWPGRRGWWTEILTPYLKDKGVYRAVQNRNPKKKIRDTSAFPMVVSDFTSTVALAPPGTADMVLTFRNLHNWMKRDIADNALNAFYAALKPGGVLGMVDHRGHTDRPQAPKAMSGYVREDYAIALAEKAGFRFVGKSEANANAKDTRDYPAGVWTLPPSYRLKDKDRAKYAAIGESDRFILKFQKPAR